MADRSRKKGSEDLEELEDLRDQVARHERLIEELTESLKALKARTT